MTYADVRSVLVLGDSVSKGVVFDPGKGRYTFSDAGFIKRLAKKIRPEVFDCSKFGSTTEYGKRLLRQRMDALSPDLVLIEYGSNDCDFKWDEVAQDPLRDHRPKLTIPQYVANIEEMVRTVREKGGVPVLTNLHPLVAERYFNRFTKNDPARQAATMVWLKQISRIYCWQAAYSNALERVGAALGADVVNIRGAFLCQENFKDFLCEDGIHPNEAGHALLEEAFLDAIRRKAPDMIRADRAADN